VTGCGLRFSVAADIFLTLDFVLALGLDAFQSHGHWVTKNFLHGKKRWASERGT